MNNRIKKKSRTARNREFDWIGLQYLEPRLTLAGDGITASVHGGTLMIKGGKTDTVIIVDDASLDEGEIRISTGESGIPINHHKGDVVLSGFTRDIKVVLGKGNDHITFDDVTVPGSVSVVGGPGNDTVTFDGGEVKNDVKLVTGPGNETISMSDVSVARDLSLVTGPEGANITLLNVEVRRKTNIQNGPSDDTLMIDDSLFHGSVRVHTGTGSDNVLIETLGDPIQATTVFEGALNVSLDNGDDHMRVGIAGDVGHSVVLDAKTVFDGGPGFDTLSNPEANGASDSSHLTVVNFEAFAPFVVSTSPAANATGASVGTTITATFDVEMDPDTINAATFTLTDTNGPIAGTVTYSGKTATFTPSAPLTAGTVYTARITTGAKDLSGVELLADFVWTFTTA